MKSCFNKLDEINYFDNAAVGIVPEPVRISTAEMLADRSAWGTAADPEMASEHVMARAEQAVRGLLGVTSGKSFVASSAMGALDAILLSVPRTGGTVVCASSDYPGLVDVARRLSRQRDLKLNLLPASSGSAKDLLAEIDDRTGVVLVSQVHWLTGQVNDLGALGDARRRLGFRLVVDASQGLPIAPINPETIDADVVVAAGYKWMGGMLGSALVHVSSEVHERLLDALGSELWPAVPSTQSYLAMHTLAGSISWMEAYGLEQIRARTLEAARAVRECGLELGWKPFGDLLAPQASGIVSFPCAAELVEAVVARARACGLFVSARGAAIRLSPHFTVSVDECREAVRLLQTTIADENNNRELR